ncbi:hypothetical protein ACNOYE_09670 [Nannocystaceae bacterium ST9]
MPIVASTDWAEQIPPDEDARLRGYADELRMLARARASKLGRKGRALHFKPHVDARAEVIVGELPEQLRVGPFAAPRTWPGYVRFSNGGSRHVSDGAPDVRGVAFKLVGVPGAKLIPGLEQALTQDLLFIHTAATPVAGPDDFIALIRAAKDGPLALVPRLIGAMGLRKAFRVIKGVAGMAKVTSMASTRFYTALPLRFGDRAVKLDLLPETEPSPSLGKGDDALRDDLIARLKTGPIAYRLRAQFFVDEASTPIEDASVVWPTPYHELARIVVPQQDIASAKGKALEDYVETLSFDPWHALPELRPLGAMMRARGHAYRESVLERGAAGEPDGSESF